MPKKNKSMKNSGEEKVVRQLKEKGEETNYAVVTKSLGNCHFRVKLYLENKEVIARLCGKFRKGFNKKDNYVEEQSVVLVSMRDFGDTVDIIHVYKAEEVRELRKRGEFERESIGENEEDKTNVIEDDNPFDFEEI
jgi:initiation factor 1A